MGTVLQGQAELAQPFHLLQRQAQMLFSVQGQKGPGNKGPVQASGWALWPGQDGSLATPHVWPSACR